MKKALGLALAMVLLVVLVSACTQEGEPTPPTPPTPPAFDKTSAITVVSREDGSGTRGAFVELVGVLEKGADGKSVDKTTTEATIVNSTSVVMTTVAGNKYAIGYISLGSLNDTVKALKVGGVEATSANVQNGSYKIARPFNIATKGEVSAVAQDFIDYIMSKEGQAVIKAGGYIPVAGDNAYAGTKPSGKVVVAASSSVTPIMEKLKEAYLKLNTGATIEIQMSDSGTGMNATKDGLCDIGMASRDLKDSEKEVLTGTTIAIDGIAVIVNKENTMPDITVEKIKDIFTGSLKTWSAVE